MRPTTDDFAALQALDQFRAQQVESYDSAPYAPEPAPLPPSRRSPEARRKAKLAAGVIMLCFTGYIGAKLAVGSPAPAPQVAASDAKTDARAPEKAVDPMPVATTAPAAKASAAKTGADKTGADKGAKSDPAAKPVAPKAAAAKVGESKASESKASDTKAGTPKTGAKSPDPKAAGVGVRTPDPKPSEQKPARAKSVSMEDAATLSHLALLDPQSMLGAAPAAFGADTPLAPTFEQADSRVALLSPVLPPIRPTALGLPAQATPPAPAQTAALEQTIPMPPPRPAAFAAIKPARPAAFATTEPQLPIRAATGKLARLRPATPPQAPADGRGFFEKLFAGAGADPAGPTMAYAAPQDSAARSFGGVGSSLGSPQTAGDDRYTAVYDIAAQKVFMPNGTTLEAHSGLGAKMDDPRHVHVRMNGATPPSLYDLREREALFHGVRAIRLLPVGGPAAIHGRSGILAHTYMLGPNGQSNGCVSFRNYDAFLQAYLRGEVKRLRVVAGRSSRFASN